MAKGIPEILEKRIQREMVTIQSGQKSLALDRVPPEFGQFYKYAGAEPVEEIVRCGYWRIWLAANKDFTLGTYAKLYDSGRLEYVTVREDEPDDITVVKE